MPLTSGEVLHPCSSESVAHIHQLCLVLAKMRPILHVLGIPCNQIHSPVKVLLGASVEHILLIKMHRVEQRGQILA